LDGKKPLLIPPGKPLVGLPAPVETKIEPLDNGKSQAVGLPAPVETKIEPLDNGKHPIIGLPAPKLPTYILPKLPV